MASSSSDKKGKGVVDENQPQAKRALSLMEGVVLCFHQILYLLSGQKTHVRSKKLFDTYVSFTLSEAEADYVRRMDEVARGSSNAVGETIYMYMKVTMADRFAGWIIETRQRLDSTKKIELIRCCAVTMAQYCKLPGVRDDIIAIAVAGAAAALTAYASHQIDRNSIDMGFN